MIPNYSLSHATGEWGEKFSGGNLDQGQFVGYCIFEKPATGYFASQFNGTVAWFNGAHHQQVANLAGLELWKTPIEKYKNCFRSFPKGTVITFTQE